MISRIFWIPGKHKFFSLFVSICFCLAACGAASSDTSSKDMGTNASGKTIIYVLGTIHGRHLTSDKYSLDVLRRAIVKANPDVILTEIPPDRLAKAEQGFLQTGKVTEDRVRAFPEYTDVVFPLTRKLPFKIVGTAAWTQKLADDRSKELKRIEGDSHRKKQWQAHLAAQNIYAKKTAGRSDDPIFIHSNEYDSLVEEAQKPYQENFETDLGAGGWKNINSAHNKLIGKALDEISGQSKTVVITFGSWHKYMILKEIEKRNDVLLRDSHTLFQ